MIIIFIHLSWFVIGFSWWNTSTMCVERCDDWHVAFGKQGGRMCQWYATVVFAIITIESLSTMAQMKCFSRVSIFFSSSLVADAVIVVVVVVVGLLFIILALVELSRWLTQRQRFSTILQLHAIQSEMCDSSSTSSNRDMGLKWYGQAKNRQRWWERDNEITNELVKSFLARIRVRVASTLHNNLFFVFALHRWWANINLVWHGTTLVGRFFRFTLCSALLCSVRQLATGDRNWTGDRKATVSGLAVKQQREEKKWVKRTCSEEATTQAMATAMAASSWAKKKKSLAHFCMHKRIKQSLQTP